MLSVAFAARATGTTGVSPVADAMRGPALRDVHQQYRQTPALALWNGPLLLAKSRRLGMTTEQLEDAAMVIGKGCRPILTRRASDRVMAAWDV